MLEQAEAAHRAIAEELAQAETRARRDRAARAAEAALSAARERVVRVEGEAAQAEQAWGVVAERVLERLGATPALPDPPADLFAEGDGQPVEDRPAASSSACRRSARRWAR